MGKCNSFVSATSRSRGGSEKMLPHGTDTPKSKNTQSPETASAIRVVNKSHIKLTHRGRTLCRLTEDKNLSSAYLQRKSKLNYDIQSLYVH
jgi:hypothetical protein